MRPTRIVSPLPGEHLVGTAPVMRPETTGAGWRLRLHYWAGRALTAEALELEQGHRAGRLAWRGRVPTPGIVTGLEVALEMPAKLPDPLARDDHFVHVLPGHGFLADGEDVVVPRPLRVPLADIPVAYVRAGGPDGAAPPEAAPVDVVRTQRRTDTDRFVLDIDTFIGTHVPWAAVLVACPAEFRVFEGLAPTDPCELDSTRDPFLDDRRVDAVTLRLIELPAAWKALRELGPDADPRRRNRIAHVLLREEAAFAARHQLRYRDGEPQHRRWDTVLRAAAAFPWELAGVPLALFGSELSPDGSRRQYFLDRAAVARPGGRARIRTRPTLRLGTATPVAALDPPGAGTPFTWRAAVDQFVEHLGALPTQTAAEVTAAAGRFQFLPPAGFLPRSAIDLLTTAEAMRLPPRPGQPPDRAGVNHFFPAAFAVEAVPVAVEDLDAALASSAPLAPYDLDLKTRDAVRVLVPVSQRLFDPRMLVVEQEDPLFAATVARFAGVRQDWRQRRDGVRSERDGLETLVYGPLPPSPFQLLERGQLEPEPVETAAGLGYAAALLSPALTSGAAELSVTFEVERNRGPVSPLVIVLRLDLDAMPSAIEVRWHTAAGPVPFTWTEMPAWPPERMDDAGIPLATPLAHRFVVTAPQAGVTGAITGFTLHLENGRVAVVGVGTLLRALGPGSEGKTVDNLWWRADDNKPPATFLGGEWTRITGPWLMAPFEQEYHAFPPAEEKERLTEIETALNPKAPTARVPAVSIGTHGLTRVLAVLEQEASEADDFVDANFTRVQVNLYRIRKLILGERAAQKLLINPAIAAIAEQETATASAGQLGAFLTAAKLNTVSADEVNGALQGKLETLRRDVTTGTVFRSDVSVNPTIGRADTRERLVRGDRVEDVAAVEAFRRAGRGEEFSIGGLSLETFLGDSKADILGQRPEIGATLPPRGLSIGQRFPEPKSSENLSYARAALVSLLDRLPRLRLALVDESIRVLESDKTEVTLLALQGRAQPTAVTNPPSTPQILRSNAVKTLLKVTDQPQTDEAEVTLAAMDVTELHSAILRGIERVIQRQRALIQKGRELVAALTAARDAAAGRVLALDGRLAEARHDVGVARALRQEEQERVAAVNERRDTLIRDEVKFLAYVRPRTVDLVRRNLHYWTVDSVDVPATVPACLQQHDEPVPALSAYIQLFRHAPARWFTALAPLLAKLDTPDKMIALLDAARLSAASFVRLDTGPALRGSSQAVQYAVLGAQQVIGAVRQRSTIIDIADKRGYKWQDFHRDAEEHASVGDLVGGRHGSTEVSASAAAELEQIARVATCLHAEFAAVTPVIRLAWIERFSQFDRPALLRDLTVLPQYGSLDRATRRRLQEFVDWLFARVNGSQKDAVILINDLVRLCLLLASHAPVNRIIAGHVPRPTPVRPGIRIPIKALNPELVRVGMDFHVWSASRIVARGRVDDLQDGEVTARVDTVEGDSMTLDATMQVQFMMQTVAFRR